MRNFFLSIFLPLPLSLFAQGFEELCKQRVDYEETPGIAVAIYENNKSQFFSFGYANVSFHTPVTSKTLFEIGYVTQVFTCAALSYLVQTNELSLSDPAQKYLPPSFVLPQKNGKPITLVDLATAHSGLSRMPGNFSPQDASNPYRDYTERELTAFLNNCELNNPPGAKYEYSNLGMGLLGFILTQKKNESYSELIRQTILTPLNMNQTFISGEIKNKLLATGYMDRNPVKAWTWTPQSALTGAGGIISTSEDMLTFLITQLNTDNTLLSKAFQDAQKTKNDAGGEGMQIGLGWHIRDRKFIWHNGGTGGFRSFVAFDLETKRAIVILTNSTTSADDLGFHWLNKSYPLKTIEKPLTLKSSQVKEYEGSYEINSTFKIIISSQGDLLFFQATGHPKLSLYAADTDKFFLKVSEAKIQFGRTAEGKIDKIRLYQNGAEMIGKKISK